MYAEHNKKPKNTVYDKYWPKEAKKPTMRVKPGMVHSQRIVVVVVEVVVLVVGSCSRSSSSCSSSSGSSGSS
jgi:hypothetical protein